MKKALLMLALAVPLLSGCASMFKNDGGVDYTTPQGFLVEIAASRAKEEAAAHIAIQRSQIPQVRDYANRILADAQANDVTLQALARANNVTFPAPITPEDQDDINNLSSFAPSVFDKFYAEMTMNDERDILDMETAAANRNAPDVSQYAQASRSLQRKHFDDATALSAAVGAGIYGTYMQ